MFLMYILITQYASSVRQIGCLTMLEIALSPILLGVSYSHWIPAEGSIVAPFSTCLARFSFFSDPKDFQVEFSVSRRGEGTSVRKTSLMQSK